MKTKSYYYSLEDMSNLGPITFTPFSASTFKAVIDEMIPTPTSLPFALTDTDIEKMWQMLVAEKHLDHIFKIDKPYWSEVAPDNDEIDAAFSKWLYKLLSVIAKTYDYYHNVIASYNASVSALMSDVKATSKNAVRFNDTPQSSAASSVYEVDNYLTHFTSTEGESSSPMNTKIMRLKEIQDHFKRTMADWLLEVGRIFLPEGE